VFAPHSEANNESRLSDQDQEDGDDDEGYDDNGNYDVGEADESDHQQVMN